MRAGARGYILKDTDEADISRAILSVGRGDAVFGAAIASRVIAYFNSPSIRHSEPFPELTDSERNVLRLMASGANNLEIAHQLSLSNKTIRNYVSNIFSKLRVADRAQAIIKAREAGLK
jgi:DNA-binding NarL/FixJ family response regulator